jgi:uncharacterized SAM-binding protein YcdF (DUF218 family)
LSSFKNYDLVIVLGSQIKKEGKNYTLAPHTKLKAEAAGIAFKRGIVKRFIISGGYNLGVRYDEREILKNPDFSFESFARARLEKSEAQVIAEFLHKEYGVPIEAMYLEEISATTRENAEIVKIILSRKPTFGFVKTIGILTLIYHMEKALPIFKEVGLNVESIFAEDLLAMEGETGIKKVCEYYSILRSGKQWPVDKIKELLLEGRSIGELLK